MTPGGADLRLLRSPWLRRSFAAIVVIALSAAIFLPRSRRLVVTADQSLQWSADQAPPRREIVWAPAIPLAIDGIDSADAVRPQRSDHGRTLYFTLRGAKGDCDIVRCSLVDGKWSQPESVDVLNSPADDVGPVIRADGQVLYLYSNRDGGHGGSDLYVARRQGDRWLPPENLGAAVNGPAHEMDPAISPDGNALYFASNRSESIGSSMKGRDGLRRQMRWGATLRTDLGAPTFDLYVTRNDDDAWGPAQPVDHLNTSSHHEGSPVVSPDGAFLWFASDRPQRTGEQANHDLYRVRIDTPRAVVENIGGGVNTPEDEIEPALDESGFRLTFSRSGRQTGTPYALFQSTAAEVLIDRQAKPSLAKGLLSSFGQGLRRVGHHAPATTLTLILLAILAWLLRHIVRRRMAIPGFLLAALVIHLVLVTGSFFVFFRDGIGRRIRELIDEEVVIASEVLLPATTEEASTEPRFDAVSELPAATLRDPRPIGKRNFESAATAIPSIDWHAPTPKRRIAGASGREPVVATMPGVAANVSRAPPDISRRHPTAKAESAVAIEVVPIVSVRSIDSGRPSPVVPSMPQRRVELTPTPIEPITSNRPFERRSPRIEPITPVIDIAIPESDLDASPLEQTQRRQIARDVSSGAILTEISVAATNEEVEQGQSFAPRFEPSPAPRRPLPESLSRVAPAAIEAPMPRVAFSAREQTRVAAEQQSALPSTELHSDDGALTRLTHDNSRVDSEAHSAPIALAAIAPLAEQVGPNAQDTPVTSVKVTRHEADPAKAEVASPIPKLTSIASAIGSIDRRVDSLGDGLPSPLDRDWRTADRLERRSSTRTSRLGDDEDVRLRSLLQRRQLDEPTKAAVVHQFGGGDETLASIRQGLTWIAQHQHSDGHWGLHNFHENCRGHGKCNGGGGSRSDTAGTALALLPFLGDGNTHRNGPHRELVARGITWLVSHQKTDGDLFTGGQDIARMYSHGIATIALCECYGMSGDGALRAPAQRAIDFIVASQDPKSGGWRYQPRSGGDTSVVGWQVMALKSGQMADLNVPASALEGARRWIAGVAGKKGKEGQFAYQPGRFNPAMTAEALLCLEYLGAPHEDPSIRKGAEFLLAQIPREKRESSYYWYYGTQTMFHLQGERWRKWNDALYPILIQTQKKEGSMTGTWDARDQWERSGGRLYATSLRLLMLEVYYRHLPLYDIVE